MPVPAHYAVVVGDEIEIIGRPHTETSTEIQFDLPSDLLAAGALGKAVLQILTRPSNDPENLQVKISINGSEVFNFGPTSETIVRSFHGVFNGAVLVAGKNTMRVSRFGIGTGAFGFSDVVIMYGLRISRSPSRSPRKVAKKVTSKRTAKKANVRRKKRSA